MSVTNIFHRLINLIQIVKRFLRDDDRHRRMKLIPDGENNTEIKKNNLRAR